MNNTEMLLCVNCGKQSEASPSYHTIYGGYICKHCGKVAVVQCNEEQKGGTA